MIRVGQNHTFIGIYYIRSIYGISGREITIHTVIYGVYIRFWPTLHMICAAARQDKNLRLHVSTAFSLFSTLP